MIANISSSIAVLINLMSISELPLQDVQQDDFSVIEMMPWEQRKYGEIVNRLCDTAGEAAEILMGIRQSGLSKAKVLQLQLRVSGDFHRDLMVDLIELAWGEPIWSTDEMRENAVTHFRERAVQHCQLAVLMRQGGAR